MYPNFFYILYFQLNFPRIQRVSINLIFYFTINTINEIYLDIIQSFSKIEW